MCAQNMGYPFKVFFILVIKILSIYSLFIERLWPTKIKPISNNFIGCQNKDFTANIPSTLSDVKIVYMKQS
jgi:hypothetical protein